MRVQWNSRVLSLAAAAANINLAIIGYAEIALRACGRFLALRAARPKEAVARRGS